MSIAWRLSVALSFRRSGELRQAQARRVSRRARSVSSLPAEHHEGVLEEGDQPRVVAGPRPLVASAGTEGGASQLSSVPRAASDVRCLEEGGARRVEIAGLRLRVAERQQRLGLRVVVGRAAEGHHRERHAVQPRGLLIREGGDRLIAGASRVLDRLPPDRRVVDGAVVPGRRSPGRSGRRAQRGDRRRLGPYISSSSPAMRRWSRTRRPGGSSSYRVSRTRSCENR